MGIYAVVLLSLLTGICLQRISNAKTVLTPALNWFAIYIALPAIVLAKVPLLELDADTLFTIISAWVCMLVSAAIFIPLSRLLNWNHETTIVCITLAGLGNTAFLGLALIKLLANDNVLGFAIIYDQLGSFIVLSITFPLILGFRDKTQNRSSVFSIIKSIVLFPPFASLVIALSLPIESITRFLQTPLEWLSLSLLPIAMIVVGMQMQLSIEKEHVLPATAAIGYKMLFFPLLIFTTGSVLSIEQDIFHASLLQSAMPAMVTPTIFLISLNLAPRLAAFILGLGTILSFVTIPTIAFFIK